jgi:hypothetical protein
LRRGLFFKFEINIYIKKELKENSGAGKLKSKMSGLLNCTYLKGIFGFSFWTKINVQKRKPNYRFGKGPFKTGSDHNALKFYFQ